MRATVILILFCLTGSAMADPPLLYLDPNLVCPWSKQDKDQFPTPLVGIFRLKGLSLIFVGDHHTQQTATFDALEAAFRKYSPRILVVEGVDYADGVNPSIWMNKFISKTKEELLQEGGIGPNAARLAFLNHIPVIGGEPSMAESMTSPFLRHLGFERSDILNVQILQRIPYRRDVLAMKSVEEFFDYALQLYKVPSSKKRFARDFLAWYKNKTGKTFDYGSVSKEETAVNCLPTDTFLQRTACAFNENRDRALVDHIQILVNKYRDVLVAYGTGHFVQEYPAFLPRFWQIPRVFGSNDYPASVGRFKIPCLL